MQAITIDRVESRFRLSAEQRRHQSRLRRAVDDGLSRTLDGAIARQGIAAGHYICIDSLKALATLRLRQPDSELASAVGDAIAQEIRRLIDRGDASIVTYTSRAHALADMIVCAAAGDFTRAWAWTQVGIWRTDAPIRREAATEMILRRVAMEPLLIVAVLSHVARAYRARFVTLLADGPPHTWTTVALAARRAGMSAEADAVPRLMTRNDVAASASRHARRLAERLCSASPLLMRAAEIRDLAPETVAAIVVLAALECEPAAATSIDLEQVCAAAAELIRHGSHHRDGARISIADRTAPESAGVATDRRRDVDRVPRTRRSGDADDTVPVGTGHPLHHAAGDTRRPAFDDRDTRQPLSELRLAAGTRFGGVLYLVNLLPRMGLIERVSSEEQWSDRGLRWVLHDLAMSLTGTTPDDPAVLAFAGLPPNADPPSRLQPPVTDIERDSLSSLRADICAALIDCIRPSGPRDDAGTEAVLAEVCRRDAEVIADPGWIEVRFRADAVSLDVRRAGLDLDPGWLRWLGTVLRFVYA